MTFTGTFQSWFGDGAGWLVATTVLILAIILPVMVGVAMAV